MSLTSELMPGFDVTAAAHASQLLQSVEDVSHPMVARKLLTGLSAPFPTSLTASTPEFTGVSAFTQL